MCRAHLYDPSWCGLLASKNPLRTEDASHRVDCPVKDIDRSDVPAMRVRVLLPDTVVDGRPVMAGISSTTTVSEQFEGQQRHTKPKQTHP